MGSLFSNLKSNNKPIDTKNNRAAVAVENAKACAKIVAANKKFAEDKYYSKFSIKDIICHYEYIKCTKHIYDIDTILNISENTDWKKVTNLNDVVNLANYDAIKSIPSAPPMPVEMQLTTATAIAIPIFYNDNELI